MAPPTLAAFTRLLRIITEELVRYRIWPVRLSFSRTQEFPTHVTFAQENCWFFCSLIQQHLGGANTGWFQYGTLKHTGLANDIRERVNVRIWAGSPIPHLPPMNETLVSQTPARGPPPLSPSFRQPSSPSPLSTSPSTLSSLSMSVGNVPPYESPSARLIEALWALRQDQSVEANTQKLAIQALVRMPILLGFIISAEF